MTPPPLAVSPEAMLAQVQAWAAVNSGSANMAGLARMAGLLADAFSPLPGELRLAPADPVEAVAADGGIVAVPTGDSLHLLVRPEAPLQLLFTGHMDTVYPADHPFQDCVWREPGMLMGPGVADMKGGLAILLAALLSWERGADARRIGYAVLINADEEVGSLGSARLIGEAARGKAAALTYEPAVRPDGTLAGARPGSGNFSLVVAGRSAHAGRNPEDGRNALVAAADLAVSLAQARRPGLAVNPARIDGGGPNNVVPAHAVLRVNLRPASPEDERAAQALLDAEIARVAREHDVRVRCHGRFARPPRPVDGAMRLLLETVRDVGRGLGLALSWQDSGGVCDGNNIARAGVPVVDTMGARGGAIHSADEYLVADSLEERAQLSLGVLRRLAGVD